MLTRPETIHVKFAEQEVDLVRYQLGSNANGDRRVLIMAGVHGREHGGIQTAYEVLQRLSDRSLHGRIDVLPVCNPLAYAAETRFTPHSGRNMTRSFCNGSPADITEALAQAVLRVAKTAQVVLNLHSAGEARYLSHAIYYRTQDTDWVARLGLPFIIKRRGLDELPGHIATRLSPEQRTVTLELGGGVVSFPEEVALGSEVILALLGQMGFLGPGEYERSPTPLQKIYLYDARTLLRAPSEGAFYTHFQPGADLEENEPFGFWVPLDGLHPQPVRSPITGQLIYVRTRNRVPSGHTLGMFLPHQRM